MTIATKCNKYVDDHMVCLVHGYEHGRVQFDPNSRLRCRSRRKPVAQVITAAESNRMTPDERKVSARKFWYPGEFR